MAEYVTLSLADRLLIARDVLRGQETDYYRLTLTTDPNKDARLADYEASIARLQEEIASLEAEVQDESA